MVTASKRKHRQQANRFALSALGELRKMINPMADESKLAYGREAARLLASANTIFAALEDYRDPETGEISPDLQPEVDEVMRSLAQALTEMLAPHGFALLVFSFGEDSMLNYISNAQREDMIAVMREFIARQEAQ